MSKIPSKTMMDLPVSFGSVSFGRKTVRIGITVDRNELKLPVADKTFCDRRLTTEIFAAAAGDQVGQGRLEGMDESLELTGVADVKSFGVHATTFTFGLTFNTKELRRSKVSLSDFAAREGRLMIQSIDEIPEAEKGEEGSDE